MPLQSFELMILFADQNMPVFAKKIIENKK